MRILYPKKSGNDYKWGHGLLFSIGHSLYILLLIALIKIIPYYWVIVSENVTPPFSPHPKWTSLSLSVFTDDLSVVAADCDSDGSEFQPPPVISKYMYCTCIYIYIVSNLLTIGKYKCPTCVFLRMMSSMQHMMILVFMKLRLWFFIFMWTYSRTIRFYVYPSKNERNRFYFKKVSSISESYQIYSLVIIILLLIIIIHCWGINFQERKEELPIEK